MTEEMTNPAPLANSPEARTPDGTLKNQSTTETKIDTSTTTEAKSADSKPADGTTLLTEDEAKPEADAKPEVKAAPETYEAFKAPEGYEYDAKALEEVTPIFKEARLSQESAQKLMDLYAAKSLEAIKDAAEAGQKAYDEMQKSWRDATIADKDIGGKLPQVKVDIDRALNTLNDKPLVDEFKKAMDLTGAGNHPAFVKAFHKLAQAVIEGTHVAGAGPSKFGQTANGLDTKLTGARAMYPNLPSQS